jgi:uncharacterized protein YndB with AHSA1/START domain
MAELTREIVVKASPATIFEFLTIPEKMLEWQGTSAELDPRPGGVYRVLTGGNHQSAGEFLEVVPNELVSFTFGWDEPDHPIPAGSTKLAISLIPEGENTRVRLVHSGLPDDAISDHTKGWDHYLGRLEVVATGGTVEADGAMG